MFALKDIKIKLFYTGKHGKLFHFLVYAKTKKEWKAFLIFQFQEESNQTVSINSTQNGSWRSYCG